MDPATAPPVPILPEGCQLVYINEGAANVVYRIVAPAPATPEPALMEEYSATTPPPSILERSEEVDMSVFASK